MAEKEERTVTVFFPAPFMLDEYVTNVTAALAEQGVPRVEWETFEVVGCTPIKDGKQSMTIRMAPQVIRGALHAAPDQSEPL